METDSDDSRPSDLSEPPFVRSVRWWDTQPARYEARERLAKYVISASIAVGSLLVLSRDKLPLQPLLEHWGLYRFSLIAAAMSALFSFLVYVFSYRERFYWEFFDDKWRQDPAINEVSRFWIIYARIARVRRPLEFGIYWLALTVAPVAFAACLLSAGALVVLCF